MQKLGILAYGSLIRDPGCEIESVLDRRMEDVRTPFGVEFARSSLTRGGAPTLVPVEEGGAHVKATVLVLRRGLSVEEAKDMLYRREKHCACSKDTYSPRAKPGRNTICIEELSPFCGIGHVYYTKLSPNIDNLNPQRLAKLAICSARGRAGGKRLDGISYLICAKCNETCTPLMPEYESNILRMTGQDTLEAALDACRKSTQNDSPDVPVLA